MSRTTCRTNTDFLETNTARLPWHDCRLYATSMRRRLRWYLLRDLGHSSIAERQHQWACALRSRKRNKAVKQVSTISIVRQHCKETQQAAEAVGEARAEKASSSGGDGEAWIQTGRREDEKMITRAGCYYYWRYMFFWEVDVNGRVCCAVTAVRLA